MRERGLLLPLLALLACAAPHEQPVALTRVSLPMRVRPGSPIELQGVSLGGARVAIEGEGTAIELTIGSVSPTDDGGESALVALPNLPALPEGAALRRVCLRTTALEGWQTCKPVQARWTLKVEAGEAQLAAQQGHHGDAIAVHAADLLLPGEGQAWLDVQDASQEIATTALVPIATRLGSGREHGEVTIAPSWLGLEPGKRAIRVRLVQQTPATQVAGPWTPPLSLEVLAPEMHLLPGGGLRRGAALALTIAGVPAQWSARLSGSLRSAEGAILGSWSDAAPLVFGAVQDGALPVATLDSPLYLNQIAPLLGKAAEARLSGMLRIELRDGAQTWLATPLAVDWPLQPTLQVVVLDLGDGLQAAAQRFGLGAFAAALRLRILALTAAHFAAYNVLVTDSAPAGQLEALHLAILDRDPNDLGLLGADSSAGKDDGNRVLDEHLGGYGAAAAAVGDVAYGGVFIGGFLGFSAILHPGSAAADPAFDALFAPYAAALGGRAALASHPPAAAIEALAQLIAHTAAHEVGHALGLASGTTAFHHEGDHPGWIMDAGPARPFAERAGLDSGVAATWGPLDDAYLRAILPKAP